MQWVYSVAAVLGGTVMLCQFAMTLLGLGHDTDGLGGGGHDLGHDLGHAGSADHHGGDQHAHESTGLFKILTVRTVVAALTFFGLAGLAASSNDVGPAPTFVISLATGGGAMYGVFWMMQAIQRMQSDGTARIERAIGLIGSVYLRIPANNAGTGKVHLNLQSRTMEYQARTTAEALPTGAKIVVVAVAGPDTVEVRRATESEQEVQNA